MTDEPGTASNGEDEASAASVKLFYGNSVASTAQILNAMKLEGIDEELGVLRALFKELTDRKGTDIDLLLRAAEMIGRTVMRRHRISPKRADELAGSVGEALKSIADQLFPERLEV
jgi:hypothetical protein